MEEAFISMCQSSAAKIFISMAKFSDRSFSVLRHGRHVCAPPYKALIYRLGKPKSVASVIYLDVVNSYTVIQHVNKILDDFVVSAVSSQNCAGKCAKSQVLFLPTASQSFFWP